MACYDYLDKYGKFTRWLDVCTEEDFWTCDDCGSRNCDPYEEICFNCGGNDE